MIGSITPAPGLGVVLVPTPTPSMPSADPSSGRVRIPPTGYLGLCQKKKHMVSSVCMGSSPCRAVLIHPRVLHLLYTGTFNLV